MNKNLIEILQEKKSFLAGEGDIFGSAVSKESMIYTNTFITDKLSQKLSRFLTAYRLKINTTTKIVFSALHINFGKQLDIPLEKTCLPFRMSFYNILQMDKSSSTQT